MGTATEAGVVQLIVGILASSLAHLGEARDLLAETFGRIARASEPRLWTVSPYYSREMGDEIWRQFTALGATVRPDALVQIKLQTNAMEQRWMGASGRQVNLDPGYLDLNKLVLASTKDAAHRIYLDRGIYAEATLRYAEGSFQPYVHTYPDYAAPETIAFFNDVRAAWKATLRA